MVTAVTTAMTATATASLRRRPRRLLRPHPRRRRLRPLVRMAQARTRMGIAEVMVEEEGAVVRHPRRRPRLPEVVEVDMEGEATALPPTGATTTRRAYPRLAVELQFHVSETSLVNRSKAPALLIGQGLSPF